MSTTAHTKLFGTDGIRGKAGEFPLDPPTVVPIGQAVGELLGGEILVGRDPRESGPWLFGRLKEGILKGGARVHDAGILPTPAVAWLTRRSGAAGGIMISASHNPFEDNGIKVFGANGEKLDDLDEATLEGRVSSLLSEDVPRLPSGAQAVAEPNGTIDLSAYLDLLRAEFPRGRWLEGFRIVLDCANGATSRAAPRLFESLGAAVRTLHADPDGRNINAGCGAVYPDSLIAYVRGNKADLGVAYDGDGDRAMFVSGTGRLVDGDGVLLVIARALRTAGRLTPPAVVGTSMTNVALERMLATEGIRLHRVDVGDRFVFRKMRGDGIVIGGEPSGHIIFSDHGLSGDGLLTTLKICEVMSVSGASLDDLTRDWKPAPQLLRSIQVSRKVPLGELPAVSSRISHINELLRGRGRIVVRYSGTETVLRIMIESDSAATNETLAGDLTRVVEESIR